MLNQNVKKSIEKISFKKKFFLFLKYLCLFILVPIIGTILHEMGHYLVAIANGYEARIA